MDRAGHPGVIWVGRPIQYRSPLRRSMEATGWKPSFLFETRAQDMPMNADQLPTPGKSPRSPDTPRPIPPTESETLAPATDGDAWATRHPRNKELEQDPTEPPAPSAASAPREFFPAPFGRYKLLKVLGKGGMGAVYLAHDSQLDRPVALKIPVFRADDDSSLKERFFTEARSAATLFHANICPIHDVGVINGCHYLTMAYVEGL